MDYAKTVGVLSSSVLEGKVTDVIQRLNEYLAKHGPETSLTVDLDTDSYGSAECTISVYRPENVSERAEREAAEAKREVDAKEYRRQQYEKLKGEFEKQYEGGM